MNSGPCARGREKESGVMVVELLAVSAAEWENGAGAGA